MIYGESLRGFRTITCEERVEQSLVRESSAIGDYADSVERPGSSYLWIGRHYHLDREQVRELVESMRVWLETGRLPVSSPLSGDGVAELRES